MAELENLDYEATGKKLIISQFKNKENWDALLRIIAEVFKDIQVNNFQLRDKFWLEDATGEQLNFIGELWDVSRGGDGDAIYRNRIYAKISQSFSGTIQDIINICKSVYGASYVQYFPEYPAGYRLQTDAVITFEQLQEISPAGVKGFLQGLLLDGNGNVICDGNDNRIVHVDYRMRQDILDGTGEQLTDGKGQPIQTFGYYEEE